MKPIVIECSEETGLYIQDLEQQNERLKEEINQVDYLVGAIVLSQGGTVRIYDKDVAGLDKNAIFIQSRDEANQCFILRVKQ